MKKILFAILVMATATFVKANAKATPEVNVNGTAYVLSCIDASESEALLNKANTIHAFVPSGKNNSDWTMVVKMPNGHFMISFSETVELDPATGETSSVDYAKVVSSAKDEDWCEYNGVKKGYCYATNVATGQLTILIYE